jgi:large subunit ribosomal protein L5
MRTNKAKNIFYQLRHYNIFLKLRTKNLEKPYFYEVSKFFISKIFTPKRIPIYYKNIHELPRFQKLTISCGLGRTGGDNPALIEKYLGDISKLVGRVPILRKTKKAIAGFNLRKGIIVGLKITLRRKRAVIFLMYLLQFVIWVKNHKKSILQERDDKNNPHYNFSVDDHLNFVELHDDIFSDKRGYSFAITFNNKRKLHNHLLLRCLTKNKLVAY